MYTPFRFESRSSVLQWRNCVMRVALVVAFAFAAAGALAAPVTRGTIGTQFAAAITAGDGAALNEMIDVGALGERVIAGLDANAADKLRYLASLRLQYASLGESVALQMSAQNAEAAFVRSLPRDEGSAFMVRITTRDALNNLAHGYLEVEINDAGDIVDWYDHTVALSLSRQLQFTASGTLTSAQFGRLLLGVTDESIQSTTSMRSFVTSLKVGDMAGAYGALIVMPESLQQRREHATLRASLSRYVGMDAYRSELAALADRHGDAPELQYVLIDHFLLTNQHEHALAAIDGAARAIGDDEVMEVNRCHVYFAQGRKTNAMAACDRAIALDPHFETPRWTLVRIGLESQDAALAVASLRGVEEATGEQLDAGRLGRNKVYAWLVEQPEWAPWAAERGWSPLEGAR